VHADFDYPKAILSVSLAMLAIGIAAFYWFRHEELGSLKGLTKRNRVAHAGYTFLTNKYYLDHLYENVIVDGIRGPIARASYWVNQHVIDGVVNGAGRGAALAGRFAYDTVDQRVVDGATNGLAYETGMAGEELRRVQGGRVQRYALLLFAAVGVLTLALFLTNSL
jgi:NADH-quinone oxidoreductase subunit L